MESFNPRKHHVSYFITECRADMGCCRFISLWNRHGVNINIIHCIGTEYRKLKQRGVATAAIMFMRNLGNTIGAALLGGILNLRLKEFFQENGGNLARNVTVDSVNSLLNQSERSRLPKQIRELLQDGLTNSLHFVYYAVLLFALISFLLIFFLPKNNENSVS